MKRGRLVEGFEFAGLKCWRERTNVFMRNERTEEMQNDFGSRVKEKFPVAKEKISRQVAAIIGEVKRCNPIVLLMHCRIRFIGGMGVSERTCIWKEDEEARRVPDPNDTVQQYSRGCLVMVDPSVCRLRVRLRGG